MSTVEAIPAAPPSTLTPIGLDGLIEIRGGASGPKAVIAGHSIRVDKVGQWYEDCGMTIEEILTGYPQLSREKIHAALAYYYLHHDAMRTKIAEDAKYVEEMIANAPPSPIRYIMKRMDEGATKDEAIDEARRAGLFKPTASLR